MKQLLFSILLVGLVSCAKKEATPTIPANTLRLTVRGKQVIFPAGSGTIVVSKQGTGWGLTARASDAEGTTISMGVTSGGPSLEATGTYSGSPSSNIAGNAASLYGYRVLTDFQNGCGVMIYQNDYITYETSVIPAGLPTTFPVFTLTVATVDAAAHTMSGTFAGTYWKGCDKLEITDGQFNLPYVVKP